MKKITIIPILIVFLVLLSGCDTTKDVCSKPIYTPEKLSDIIELTPLVIKCNITNNVEKITYDDIEFIKTDVIITDVLRGANGLGKDDSISILQSPDDIEKPLSPDENILLLLEKYEGPVTENAYVIVGGNKGKIRAVGNSLELLNIKNGTYYEEFKKYDLTTLKELIKNKPFKDKKINSNNSEKVSNDEKRLYKKEQ